MTDGDATKTAPENTPDAPIAKTGAAGALARAAALWRRIYGPFGRQSARFLDWISAEEKRRRRASLILALAINLTVLTLMSTFARVRIWIPNAPSDTIQVTLVEPLPFDLPLRDPELEPEPAPAPEPQPEDIEEPEPEPELVEELKPEPEPEPTPAEEPPAEPEPEPEPAPEPEPQIKIDLSPQLAPPAEEPEPLIIEPDREAPELAAPSPETIDETQTPDEESDAPLVSVEPESPPAPGLDDVVGADEAEGEDEARDEADQQEPDAPVAEVAPEAPSGDDMFDEEPVFGRRQFVLPQVALPQVDLSGAPAPQGEAAISPGDAGIVAIFCPEHFTDVEKQKECAGRPEIRSGWRPGSSGEDWSRATELLKQDRNRGVTGPTVGPAADLIYRKRELERTEDLQDFRRSQGDVNNLPDRGDDNISRGVEGNRPAIGPDAFEPGWSRRETPDGLSQREIDELKKKLDEDDD